MTKDLSKQGKFPVLTEQYGDVMTVDEVADYMRVSTKTVYNLIQKKRIKAKRIGREWRIPTYRMIEMMEG